MVRISYRGHGSHVLPSGKTRMKPWTSLRRLLALVLAVMAMSAAVPGRAWRAEAAAEPPRPLISCPVCWGLASVEPIRQAAPSRRWFGHIGRAPRVPDASAGARCERPNDQALRIVARDRLPRPVHPAGLRRRCWPTWRASDTAKGAPSLFSTTIGGAVFSTTPRHWRPSYARRFRTKRKSSTFWPTASAASSPGFTSAGSGAAHAPPVCSAPAPRSSARSRSMRRCSKAGEPPTC